ncbi:hypothetical protein JTB14_036639 [Gonioctena quinquepunctata]|nr:hypothetical protein JTB14_036639 [Gonioctena quinquepunctata]
MELEEGQVKVTGHEAEPVNKLHMPKGSYEPKHGSYSQSKVIVKVLQTTPSVCLVKVRVRWGTKRAAAGIFASMQITVNVQLSTGNVIHAIKLDILPSQQCVEIESIV